MIKNIHDFFDDDRTKANVIMKDGTEYLGVDLLAGTVSVLGFVLDGGARLVNREDVLYFDVYLDEVEDD